MLHLTIDGGERLIKDSRQVAQMPWMADVPVMWRPPPDNPQCTRTKLWRSTAFPAHTQFLAFYRGRFCAGSNDGGGGEGGEGEGGGDADEWVAGVLMADLDADADNDSQRFRRPPTLQGGEGDQEDVAEQAPPRPEGPSDAREPGLLVCVNRGFEEGGAAEPIEDRDRPGIAPVDRDADAARGAQTADPDLVAAVATLKVPNPATVSAEATLTYGPGAAGDEGGAGAGEGEGDGGNGAGGAGEGEGEGDEGEGDEEDPAPRILVYAVDEAGDHALIESGVAYPFEPDGPRFEPADAENPLGTFQAWGPRTDLLVEGQAPSPAAGEDAMTLTLTPANGTESRDRVHYTVVDIEIAYLGGTDETDGLQEETQPLDHIVFLKGYLLEMTAQIPGTAEEEVAWMITKGENGESVGTFHPGGEWTDYDDVLDDPPPDRTVFWRSDLGAPLAETYSIEARVGDDRFARRTIRTRALDPGNAAHRDRFNPDVDMLQRAMIQIFALDKGRLSSYEIGLYRENGPAGQKSSERFYRSSLTRNRPFWSKIAEEVENLGLFAASPRGRSKELSLPLHVTTMWEMFDLILAAGEMEAITTKTEGFDVWLANAAPSFTVPSGFARPSEDVILAIFRQEDEREAARHSFDRFDPLAVSSVRVGEAPGSAGHTFTDFGIGFGAIQPFNRGGRNIYLPDQNVLRSAELLQEFSNGLPATVTGTNARVWATAFAYNQGLGTLRSVIDAGDTPASLRVAGHGGADYADGVFQWMGIGLNDDPDLRPLTWSD